MCSRIAFATIFCIDVLEKRRDQPGHSWELTSQDDHFLIGFVPNIEINNKKTQTPSIEHESIHNEHRIDR